MCGIFGIYNNNDSSEIINYVISNLSILQDRGKDGCGIGYNTICINDKNNKNIKIIKNNGLVKDCFQDFIEKNDRTHSCIGHVRYSTSGKSSKDKKIDFTKTTELQPLSGKNKQGDSIIIVHNGNIPIIKGDYDTEVLLQLILNSEENIETRLIWIMNNIPAAYCLLIIVNDVLYVMRDRYGIRPLSYGECNDCSGFCVSSESIALENCKNIKDVEPGTILRIDGSECSVLYKHHNAVNGLCAFEILYFMNPKSYININNNNIKIESIRQTLGETLAKKELLLNTNENLNDYIVVGVPNSGITYAKAYAKYLNIEYMQVVKMIDNCINGEDITFILINNEHRQEACKKKFKYDSENIKNKKLIIIDDTIVRGTVITNIIDSCKKCGAAEIHIRIPAPPIIEKCHLGIAIHSKEELIMNKRNVNKIKTKLGINSLMYLSIYDLEMFPKDSYMEYFGCGIAREIVSG